ncbi:Dna2/Cas4 domain-containing protein [Methanofollis formosanus]|uniref:Dna2/Cas4 domain-containing protein n=1 Tax=Methanofollis formosanus TaxID=299308 RepID=A0A8G1EG95_9EURY|nr:Dna2/Cas4 domain-containing protein [Methanofollis formosanus]QYZ78916.1 Dna2/Cas4 domain-containing protein [Methanofollis formosanus]
MDDLIGIAAVVTARFCPLRLYLDRQEEHEEPPRYAVCKQVSYHLGTPFEPDAVWEEVCTVLPYAGEEERALFEQCVTNCRGKEWPRFSDHDVPVTSTALGIRGTVDKVDPAVPSFAITRASEAPQAGVWGADRVRVACFSACVRENFSLEVNGGWVEYVPSGVLRFCTPGPRDRRAMLRAVDAAKKVEEGRVPRKPLNPPCTRCPHQERCAPGPRRLSELL